MTEPSASHMVDLLPLATLNSSALSMPLIGILALSVVALLWLLFEYWHRSLRFQRARLRQQLLKQQLTPRAVAHKLVHLTSTDSSLGRQLEALRFARIEPSQQQILELLQRIR